MKNTRRIISALILVLSALMPEAHLSAQELRVERVLQLATDLSASVESRSDNNGRPCALVKVAFAQASAEFEGNVIGRVEEKAGEYLVYMSAGTKSLKLKRSGYTPLMIHFAESKVAGPSSSELSYDLVGPLVSKATYLVRIGEVERTPTESKEQKVVFRFESESSYTISSEPLKTRMESNISALLTEIDRAGRNGSPLNLTGIDMEPEAKKRLIALWGDAHFICDKQTNVYKCLNDSQGYQVRDIPVTIRPLDASYEQSLNRELTISLSKTGVITGVRPALENHDIKSMLSADGLEDVRQRKILEWIENVRCYYNEKNLKSLTQIYSDDALIITESVVHEPRQQEVKYDSKVNYKHQSKEEYIENLSRVFSSNGRINVEFDNIAVVRHPAKPNFYGVTLRQEWQSDSHIDEGWIFLLWDFSDSEHPQIHVRTWQPESYVTKEDVFTLDDFILL